MKTTAIVCAIAAAALLTSSLSQAQNRDDNRRDQEQQQSQSNNKGQSNNKSQSNSKVQNKDQKKVQQPVVQRMDSRSRAAPVQPVAVRYYNARSPEFRRGARLPNGYRGPNYVVDNWRAHHLAAPPRGQHWVQVGPDYVLAAIATGVITQLILGR